MIDSLKGRTCKLCGFVFIRLDALEKHLESGECSTDPEYGLVPVPLPAAGGEKCDDAVKRVHDGYIYGTSGRQKNQLTDCYYCELCTAPIKVTDAHAIKYDEQLQSFKHYHFGCEPSSAGELVGSDITRDDFRAVIKEIESAIMTQNINLKKRVDEAAQLLIDFPGHRDEHSWYSWCDRKDKFIKSASVTKPAPAGGKESNITPIMGKWPGDETNEQVSKALEELS